MRNYWLEIYKMFMLNRQSRGWWKTPKSSTLRLTFHTAPQRHKLSLMMGRCFMRVVELRLQLSAKLYTSDNRRNGHKIRGLFIKQVCIRDVNMRSVAVM